MNKKYLTYAIVPVMALTLIGVGTASAQGWYGWLGTTATPEEIAQKHQAKFDAEANLLGVSVNEIKNNWAQGKTIQQVAKENNISEDQLTQKLTAVKKQQMTDHLKILVDKGVITQAQADQRLKAMETMQKGKMGLGKKMGHGKNCPNKLNTTNLKTTIK